jgi:hypothetical protein
MHVFERVRPVKMAFRAALLLLFAGSAGAQVIRGTVEDSTGMPLNDVRVTLLPAASDSVLRETRTGNAGEFSLGAPRTGRYRIRLNRIGYAQLTSAGIEVASLNIVTLKLVMSVAARELAPVTVVERRNVTLNELMSASGFEMRQSKYPMFTMSAEQLATEGVVPLDVLFRNGRFFGVEVIEDTLGESLRMRAPPPNTGYCFAEVYLDGQLLSGTPAPVLEFGINLEAQMASNALIRLSSHSTDMLYGVEVYRGTQVPPASLGGLLGSVALIGSAQKPCGVVAIWTKTGRERAIVLERARANGSVQVVRGSVIDFDDGKPVPNASLILRSEYGADLEKAVLADSTGTFLIHTRHFQKMRLAVSANGYVEVVTPAFDIDVEELLTLEVIMSPRHQPLAPLALIARELARNYSATDARGFSFRRRRALGGTFFDARDITRMGATSIAELLRPIPNVNLSGGPDLAGITFNLIEPVTGRAGGGERGGRGAVSSTTTTCRPMFFLNGELQRDPQATVLSLPLSQLTGLEVFPLLNEVPFVFRVGSTGCGVIAAWTLVMR